MLLFIFFFCQTKQILTNLIKLLNNKNVANLKLTYNPRFLVNSTLEYDIYLK
jgi:hypothetical protein